MNLHPEPFLCTTILSVDFILRPEEADTAKDLTEAMISEWRGGRAFT